jgi:c(7)-type cytochrome triheme protein
MKTRKNMKIKALFASVLWFAVIAGTVVATEQDAAQTQQDEPVNSLYGAMGSGKHMFSHTFNVESAGFKCNECHPDVFARKMGTARANGDYNMASLREAKYCGACHDGKTAFDTTGPETCVKCHGSDMKPPEVLVFNRPVKGVLFSHKDHVDMGLDCASCHDKDFEMRKGAAEENLAAFNMRALYAGKYCGICHNGNIAFAANTRCTACHIGVKGVEKMMHKAAAGEKKAP